MNKKLITSLMLGTILSGATFAMDPFTQSFDNTTQGFPYILQFSMRIGSLIGEQEALSRKIDDNQAFNNQRFLSLEKKIDDNQAQNNQRFLCLEKKIDDNQAQNNQRFLYLEKKIDDNQAQNNQRFDKVDQRFDGIEKQLREIIQILTRHEYATEYRFLEGHHNLTKVAEQTSTSLSTITYQGYTNLTKAADQCYANLTIVATNSHKNLTKVEKDLTLNVTTIFTNHTARLDKLESYWTPDLYQTILTNPLLYGALISLSLATKSTSMMPAALLPYAAWGLYGTSGTFFYQVGWNFFSPNTPEHTRAILTGGLLMSIGAVILAVQKNEALIAPHITPSAFGAGMAGLMATGVISYGLKASFDLFMAWVK